ncbi:VanW family protein [Dethiobacter alkaliphilus]|uniref:VanW family protein n=1 Tax=Dethiobacter alkaliphilus TaxID=427926 RepID=UPI00222745AC|nr:VanW family protein [Dethiobacter alkaliphilus]MCW3490738.1 VanW family protein [Dethiobacter alkaliphilus]
MTETKIQRWHIVTIVILTVFTLLITADYFYHRDRIYAGVEIDGVDVGGKTAAEAAEMLMQKYEQERFGHHEVDIHYEDKTWTLTYDQLGIEVDVEETVSQAMAAGRERAHLLRYPRRISLKSKPLQIKPLLMVETVRFRAAMDPMEEIVWQEPVNADLKLSEDRESVEIIPDKPGQELNVAVTLNNLFVALDTYPDVGDIELTAKTVEAEQTAEYLESLKINEPVATFSTVFSGNDQNRNHNIRLAAEAVDDILILPGEEFSWNETVGNTTADKGYKKAPVIVGGQLQDGLGGGICQVSSTLYNAVLLADMGIIERRNHGLAVGYLPPGRDATISYGWIDLKYVNDRDYAVWQRAFVDGNRLTIHLYGNPIPGHEVEIITTDLQTIPGGEKIIKTSDLPRGARERIKSGQPGYKVTSWRITYQDGEEIKREQLFRDTYRAVPAEYRVGTAEVPAATDADEEEEEEEPAEEENNEEEEE